MPRNSFLRNAENEPTPMLPEEDDEGNDAQGESDSDDKEVNAVWTRVRRGGLMVGEGLFFNANWSMPHYKLNLRQICTQRLRYLLQTCSKYGVGLAEKCHD